MQLLPVVQADHCWGVFVTLTTLTLRTVRTPLAVLSSVMWALLPQPQHSQELDHGRFRSAHQLAPQSHGLRLEQRLTQRRWAEGGESGGDLPKPGPQSDKVTLTVGGIPEPRKARRGAKMSGWAARTQRGV
jgi:hypothetical protein